MSPDTGSERAAMRITDALLGEHGVLYALFDRIEADLEGGADPAPHARILEAVLRSHARTEDELLFEEMASREGGDGGPAPAMIEEHEEVAALLDRAGTSDGDELRQVLTEVMALARDHFRREEDAAFPVAETMLGDARLRELGAEWGARRRVSLKGGSHER